MSASQSSINSSSMSQNGPTGSQLKHEEDDFYQINDGTTLLLPGTSAHHAASSFKRYPFNTGQDKGKLLLNQSPLVELDDISLAQLINNSMSISAAPQG